jgi:hypothetical protein
MSGEQFDVVSNPQGQSEANRGGPRRFVGIQFACCGVYSRIYVNAGGTAYEGRCPRCLRPIAIKIGPGGTSERFFVAR